jgi:hypothetical protein
MMFAPAIGMLACSAPPPPAAPVKPESTVSPAPPPAVIGNLPPAPAADEGPPPQPPMATRWTFDLPSTSGRPWSKQGLAVTEDGNVTWDSESGGGDGEVDETLSPVSDNRSATPAVHCRGHVGPALHRKIVDAARRAMAQGCTAKTQAVDRTARPVDAAVTSLAVTWEGEVKSCTIARSGGGYAAFEQVKAEVITAVCAKR